MDEFSRRGAEAQREWMIAFGWMKKGKTEVGGRGSEVRVRRAEIRGRGIDEDRWKREDRFARTREERARRLKD